MKGTWSKNVFPPLVLSAEQQSQFRGLARGLVRETMAHFDAFERLPLSKRDMSKKKCWRAVKTRENLTVYKERDPPKSAPTTGSGAAEHRHLAADDWQMPKLLVGVGSIVGSLDDVMYGVITPDAEAMLLKAAIVRSSLVDGAVLAQISGPNPDEPFRFLGIKWFVKGPPATLRGLVRPRDLVFVESTGILTRSNGDRMGYQLLHSVDLDGYGALAERSLTRGRISSCTIFKETQGGRRVDVYVRGYVEQHGKLLDSVALKAASTGFLSSWNSVECGHAKKLMWFTENPHLVSWKEEAAARAHAPAARSEIHSDANGENPRGFHLRSLSMSKSGDRCGGTCGRKLQKVSSVGLCSLCQVPMCSKCRVAKKMAYATRDMKLERRESVICRSCVAKVRLQPARRIAQQEIRSGRFRWRPNQTPPRAEVAPVAQEGNQRVAYSPRPRKGAKSTLLQSDTPTNASPKPTAQAGSHFHFGGPGAGSVVSSGSASLMEQRLHVLQLQQQHELAQAQTAGQTETHSDSHLVLPTKPRWFSKRHKDDEQHSGSSRPVMFGESTMLSDCQSGTLSRCSTASETPSTIVSVSPVNPLAYSWASSAQDSEHRARVDEDSEEDWTDSPEFTESQQERQQLWQQMTELRLAVENTYKIAKHTTDSCCGPNFSPVAKSQAWQ
ncbi:hypothetical protein BBJ28_00014247 [Nothophytophthora sp. Chile5]|nr:hypothetical protein BBJ28_00014247 [Nothophytophthora sp. Chile5]